MDTGKYFEDNKALAWYWINRYPIQPQAQEDALQECYLALIEASESYREGECKFSEWYGLYIRERLKRMLVSESCCGFRVYEAAVRLKSIINDYRLKTGEDPTEDYLHRESGMTRQRVKAALTLLQTSFVSLYEASGDDDSLRLIDAIPDEASPIDELVEAIGRAQAAGQLWQAVDALPENERDAIRAHYVEGKTYSEIGADARKDIQAGLKALRKNKELPGIASAYDVAMSIAHKGSYSTFSHLGSSSTERAAMLLL